MSTFKNPQVQVGSALNPEVFGMGEEQRLGEVFPLPGTNIFAENGWLEY